MTTTLVLAEDALTAADVEHILAVHTEEGNEYHVLVPADTERNVIVTLLDQLSLADFRDALTTLLGNEPQADQAVATAQERLDASVALFAAAGASATGDITDDDPLPALRAGVQAGADDIAIVTYPHFIEDTFHQDWASKAREELSVPVLHLYRGTSELG